MKKSVLMMVILVGLVAAGAMARYVSEGFGKKLTATTTPQVQQIGSGDSVLYLRITNTGSEDIRLMLNVATNSYVATNALVVSPGFPETFYTGDPIYSFCYSAESSTSTFIANGTGSQP